MRYSSLLVAAAISFTSLLTACSKSFESEPLERITEDLIFDTKDANADYAKQFLYGVYSQLPDGFNRIDNNLLDAGTDDAVPSADNKKIDYFRNGRLSASDVVDNVWADNYKGIRGANQFLANIDKVPVDSAQKSQWKAEARFLRAYFYFELVKRWGGVPLIGDKVFTLADDLNIARSTADECFTYIISELDAATPRLLAANVADLDWGRATQGAALALKSRVTLYRASPLFNTSNDAQKWQAAATAAQALVTLNRYSLLADYVQLFLDVKDAELIFTKQRALTQDVETNNGPIGFVTGSGSTSPSQNLVDAYLMLNGKMINEDGSGYDPQNPYLNRDKRFDASIMYNGKKWLNRSVELYTDGRDRPGGNRIQTKTGYYLRKFMGKFESSSAYSNQNHHVVLLRYAEVLLNLAEAENEVNGPGTVSSPVFQSLIAIRKRAGITAGSNYLYGLPANASKEQMRTIIQNERRIELAFEEHRFWDIRRWKTAATIMNQPVKGVTITMNANSSFSYSYNTVTPSVFDAAKMYWLPIPFTEIRTNTAMVQNPGWSY